MKGEKINSIIISLREMNYSRITKYSLLLFFYTLLLGCNKMDTPEDVSKIIEHAGKNKIEILKVIKHYNNAKNIEKLEATYFLIRNMQYHNSYYSSKFDEFDVIFENLENMNHDRANLYWDSLEAKYGPFTGKDLELICDLEKVRSEMLINNIDKAFEVWKNNPWGLNISKEMFYEYILPYRSQNEHLKEWRVPLANEFSWIRDSIGPNGTFLDAYYFINKYANNYLRREEEEFLRYPISIDYENVTNGKTGSCSDETNLFTWILRANGLPVAIDYTPLWANRGSSHIWHVMLNEKEIPYSIFRKHRSNFWTNKNEKILPKSNNPVGSSEFYVLFPGDSLIPKEIIFSDKKKVSKVYRKMFSLQNKYYNDNQLFGAFKSPLIKDVTHEYVDCENVSINIPEKISAKFAYLATFDIRGWTPVAFTEIKNGQAYFKGMGKNILYLPIVITNNRLIAIENPFILTSNGEKNPIIYSPNQRVSINVKRKYPLFGNILNYMNYMYGGRFEGAQSSDFSDAETIKKIETTPYYVSDLNTDMPKKFRYIRYIPDSDRFSDIAELSFYNKKGNKLEGRIIGSEGDFGHEPEKAFDNNLDTYYGKDKRNCWIGLDLGRPKKVAKIVFCPRNDTDIIMPGLEYELFFWNNGRWNSIERKKATNYSLEFNNIPSNALYWLHCHSGGREERPFTYENGKQIWW